MSITVLLGRRVALFALFGTTGWACSPKPASMAITCQATCREGTTIQVAAEVKDTRGHVLPLPITWIVEPKTAGKLMGPDLFCQFEGKLSLRATTSGISSVREIAITSPLTGTWQRQDDQYAGMKIRISAAGDGSLAGYIVGPPNDAALASIKSERKSDDEKANNILTCSAHTWSPGLRKWSGIRRLGDKRWSVSDLSKEVHVGRSSCEEDERRSLYVEGYELNLASADRLELRDLRVNKAPQSWQRIADVDDTAIAAQKAACEKARDVAAKAYADVVPGLDENAKQVSAKFWAGNGSLGDFQATQRLATTLKAAQASLSQGAYKARQAARAIPANAAPEVKKLCELSEAMFGACKDVDP